MTQQSAQRTLPRRIAAIGAVGVLALGAAACDDDDDVDVDDPVVTVDDGLTDDGLTDDGTTDDTLFEDGTTTVP
jgi:hypothetical protein